MTPHLSGSATNGTSSPMGGTDASRTLARTSDNQCMFLSSGQTKSKALRSASRRECDHGFSLIELMVVVVILGIIAAVALPMYQQNVMKGRRADAISALSSVLQAQERWRSNNNNYADTLQTLFNTSTEAAAQASPGGHYTLTLTGLGSTGSFVAGYNVKAVPSSRGLQTADTDCAAMSVRVERGNVIYAASASDSSDSKRRCWPQ